MNPATRKVFNELQAEAGVPTPSDMDSFPDPFPQDDDWIDDPDASELPPERVNIADAVRSLRSQLWVSFQFGKPS